MKDFKTFANEHGVAFAKLYCELFQTEYFLPLSYTSIVRYFQTEFKEQPNDVHAAILIGEFLKKEGLVGRNSVIANIPSDALTDVVRYVREISRHEDSQQVYDLLLHNKDAYVEKIDALCKDIMTRFNYIKTASVAAAILSLITGWCPILDKKFVPVDKKFNSFTKDDMFDILDILSPLIDIFMAELGTIYGIELPVFWACIHSAINCYKHFNKY